MIKGIVNLPLGLLQGTADYMLGIIVIFSSFHYYLLIGL